MDKNFARIDVAKEYLEGIDVKLSGVLDPEYSSGFRQHISNQISSSNDRTQEPVMANSSPGRFSDC